jgi:hypothetical protein
VIDQLMPAANRAYGMGLLADISAGDHWGILDANVGAGASKAGWKTEPGAGWVVNQAAQLQLQGQTVGIAVTSEGSASLPAGETIMQTVATDLLAGTAAATGVLASDQIGCAAQASGTFVDGGVASILPDGEATIPQGAPAAVQAAIEAGNEIIDKPYVYGGGHSQPLTTIAASYDCSSSTSFALHGGGLLDATPEDSTELESYGQPGAGQWITVYANPIHAYIEVAGIYLDTAAGQGRPPNPPTTGPRWTPVGSGPAGFTARHPAGL